MEEWIKNYAQPLLFAAMGMLGALIAHIKDATDGTIRTLRWHIGNFFVKSVYATFVCMVVYFLHDYFQWKAQISFILAGLCSIHGAAFVELLWTRLARAVKNYPTDGGK